MKHRIKDQIKEQDKRLKILNQLQLSVKQQQGLLIMKQVTKIKTFQLWVKSTTRMHLAIKLDQLKEKSKDFLTQCLKSKFVPKGLEVKLEPTI